MSFIYFRIKMGVQADTRDAYIALW